MQFYADTANLSDIKKYNEDDRIAGFTTNPTIFKNVGVTDARSHVQKILSLTGKPVSVDGPPQIVAEMGAIPKIPVPMYQDKVNREGVEGPINFTAVCSYVQLEVLKNSDVRPHDIISVFCGRIMDSGTPPTNILLTAHELGARVLWASTRALYDVRMAERLGCDIITLQPVFIEKLDMLGEHLDKIAVRTLKQFHDDSKGLW